jgi:hypothetical protein
MSNLTLLKSQKHSLLFSKNSFTRQKVLITLSMTLEETTTEPIFTRSSRRNSLMQCLGKCAFHNPSKEKWKTECRRNGKKLTKVKRNQKINKEENKRI